MFKVPVFKVSTLVSIARGLRFAWRFHHFGVQGKLK